MKNKNFKDLVEDYFKLGLISLSSHKTLNFRYDKAEESLKERMDEYSQIVLEDFLRKNKKDSVIQKQVESIKKNIQFFTWLTIISIAGYAIVAFVIASNS